MAQYLLTYLGMPKPATPEEGKKHMTRYMEWLGSLGAAAVSPANPLKNTCVIGPDGSSSDGGKTGMSGFTIIEVATMDEALEIAQGCPFLEVGGSLEVSEIMKMQR